LATGSSSDYAPQLKPRFDGREKTYDIQFGSMSDNDAGLGIYKGKITISDRDLKPLFDPIVNMILTSCSSVIVSQKAQVM
jgi:hypothetical protein